MIERRITPVPLVGLREGLDAAHRGLHGYSLSDEAYILADAHLRLEHGVRDGSLRGVFNHNLGNYDATDAQIRSPAFDVFQTRPEHEVDRHGRDYTAVHVRVSYHDLDAGLRGYWQTLAGGYPEAYDAVTLGDADGFAAALKRARYYTADEQVYARALRDLVAEMAPTIT